MIAVLEIGAGFVLVATLLAAAMVLSAFHLGRLVTRDDEQRQVEAADAPRIRHEVRRRTMKRATIVASLALSRSGSPLRQSGTRRAGNA